jgi:hypothetical protein
MSYPTKTWLALGLGLFACAPEATVTGNAPAANTTSPTPSAAAGRSATPTTSPPVMTQAPAAPVQQTMPTLPNPMPTAAGGSAAPAVPSMSEHPMNHTMAGAAAPVQPSAAGAAPSLPIPEVGMGSGGGAEAFCAKYEMHCHYGQAQRHADKAACMADFNGNPVQQGCKNMHLDTAIAGTAAACNGMPSDFCFAIHCLHAAGIPDPTGVTYCK